MFNYFKKIKQRIANFLLDKLLILIEAMGRYL